MSRLAFRNARLIDPASGTDQTGDLIVENGVIRDMGLNLLDGAAADGCQVVEAAGRILAPGLVDMRVALREPGDAHKETIASAGAAALAGGVTAMACLPNTDPVIDDPSLLSYVLSRARESTPVRVTPYGTVTKNADGREMTEMGLMLAAGAAGFTDGTRAVADSLVMRRALSYGRTYDALILQHPEDPALADEGHMNEGLTATRLGLTGIPAAAEVILLERDLRLVALTGGRYHAAHLSTAAAVAAVRQAKAQGLAVTCDTAPHYFTLTEDAVGEYRTFAKVSPPLRGEADRLAIIAGLADGTIDAIASDHAPQDPDSKRVPFAIAEPGILGLETLLSLSLALVRDGHLSLTAALAALSSHPARILGLPGGRLTRGQPADLVLFDPDTSWRVDPDRLHSKTQNTPFEDW
ncbi:MAG: dihydroorotase, partial [Alphaproteobacteria bacterium]